jgi:3',5'-cyclic-AMP phosphodiesterase
MRIAHLSDFHLRQHLAGASGIAKRRSREVPALLARQLPALQAWQPDLLVISGDLTDYPLDLAHDAATQAAGAADIRLLLDLLAVVPCPRIIVPGNHDLTNQVMAAAPPYPGLLSGIAIHAWPDEEGEAHVPTRQPAAMAAFRAALASTDPGPQLHVQHYLIWPERNQGWPHTYGQAAAMREALESANRDLLVLSGHFHPGYGPERRRRVWYATVPAFCEAPHPIWLYEWDGPTLKHSALTLA